MERTLEIADIIKDNFFGLKYDIQLQILNLYREQHVVRFEDYFKEYIDNITPIVQFKEEYSKLNSTGRRFIRINLINRFNSVGYESLSVVDRYGYSKEELIGKYIRYDGKKENIEGYFDNDKIDEVLINYYLLTFTLLPDNYKDIIVWNFICKNCIIACGIDDYLFSDTMNDEFNAEVEQLLPKHYLEYLIMCPNKRMEFIKDLKENQIPRALTYMGEEDIRRERRKHGRHGEKRKKLELPIRNCVRN